LRRSPADWRKQADLGGDPAVTHRITRRIIAITALRVSRAPSFGARGPRIQISVQRSTLIEDKAAAFEVRVSAILEVLQDAAFKLEDAAKSLLNEHRRGLLAADAAGAEGNDSLALERYIEPVRRTRELTDDLRPR